MVEYFTNFISGSNLILMSFLPGFLYLLIIFITTPYKSWNFNISLIYFLGGCISTPLIVIIHLVFPFLTSLFMIPESIIGKLLMMAFIQVALIEELSKYLLYKIFRQRVLKERKNQHPLSVMVYVGSVSLGFAFVENIMYGFRLGIDALYWRSITSVIIHMTCGMMMGYWLSLSTHKFKIKTNPINDVSGVSIFDVVLKKKPLFRKVFYSFMAISMAVFFHGLYDLNIFGVYDFTHTHVDGNISWTIQLIILFFSLYIVKRMSNHLIKLNIKEVKKVL